MFVTDSYIASVTVGNTPPDDLVAAVAGSSVCCVSRARCSTWENGTTEDGNEVV
jgi:hypothetical protein